MGIYKRLQPHFVLSQDAHQHPNPSVSTEARSWCSTHMFQGVKLGKDDKVRCDSIEDVRRLKVRSRSHWMPPWAFLKGTPGLEERLPRFAVERF